MLARPGGLNDGLHTPERTLGPTYLSGVPSSPGRQGAEMRPLVVLIGGSLIAYGVTQIVKIVNETYMGETVREQRSQLDSLRARQDAELETLYDDHKEHLSPELREAYEEALGKTSGAHDDGHDLFDDDVCEERT